jgi:hypothetical protein
MSFDAAGRPSLSVFASAEDEFWDVNPDKSLKSFTPCYSQSPLQLCLEISIFKLTQPLTASRMCYCTVYTVKEEGGKPDRKPHHLPNGLRNLKSENSQDYFQKPQRNLTFMNSASGRDVYYVPCTVILACGLVVLIITML